VTVRGPRPDAPAGRPVQPHEPGRRATSEAPLSKADAHRFRALILPHLDQAYAFARFLTRDGPMAEDVVQEAFLKAYRAFPGFRGGEARAWLFAIVRTTFVSAQRARRPMIDIDDAPELSDEAPGAEAALVRQGEVLALRAAIDALPEPFREALVLRELEELSYREIAEVTHAPIGTVMSRLARARALLVRVLGVEEIQP
jgi:RNA polymerase sigma-70 factor (ECF subfamily)